MNHPQTRPDVLVGSLDESRVHSGVPRGKFGLYQRRVRARIFGEPLYDVELVDDGPHRITYEAWTRMVEAAEHDGVDTDMLQIHSAYRSVAWQKHIFDYWVEERRKKRAEDGLEALSLKDLQKLQSKWTAYPGSSAHHTGFAIDLKLYTLGKRESRKHPAYVWLAHNARRFGFYPYFPEAWHWEYNPPGLITQLVALRHAIAAGQPFEALLRPPDVIPISSPKR